MPVHPSQVGCKLRTWLLLLQSPVVVVRVLPKHLEVRASTVHARIELCVSPFRVVQHVPLGCPATSPRLGSHLEALRRKRRSLHRRRNPCRRQGSVSHSTHGRQLRRRCWSQSLFSSRGLCRSESRGHAYSRPVLRMPCLLQRSTACPSTPCLLPSDHAGHTPYRLIWP